MLKPIELPERPFKVSHSRGMGADVLRWQVIKRAREKLTADLVPHRPFEGGGQRRRWRGSVVVEAASDFWRDGTDDRGEHFTNLLIFAVVRSRGILRTTCAVVLLAVTSFWLERERERES